MTVFGLGDLAFLGAAGGGPIPYTSLLLHGDGTNGSTTITDSSPSQKTVTAIDGAQISTAQSKFGGASIYFDGTKDRLTLSASSDFVFVTDDFTIEFWARSADVSRFTQRGFLQISSVANGLSTTYAAGLVISQGQSNTGSIDGGLIAVIDGTIIGSSSSVLSVNTWYHIALTRASGVARLFYNGNLHASANNASNLTASNLVIGGYYSESYLYAGYIDELRITKGVARYTSNFTPPAAPFPDA